MRAMIALLALSELRVSPPQLINLFPLRTLNGCNNSLEIRSGPFHLALENLPSDIFEDKKREEKNVPVNMRSPKWVRLIFELLLSPSIGLGFVFFL